MTLLEIDLGVAEFFSFLGSVPYPWAVWPCALLALWVFVAVVHVAIADARGAARSSHLAAGARRTPARARREQREKAKAVMQPRTSSGLRQRSSRKVD